MSDTGWLLVGAGASGGTGAAWSNSGNITADDDAVATHLFTIGADSAELRGTNLGASIPEDATIDGVEVRVQAREITVSSNGVVATVGLLISSPVGTAKTPATALTTTLTDYDYGGPSDLWGASLSDVTVAGSSFGAYIKTSVDAGGARVDAMWIKIYYTSLDTSQDIALNAIAAATTVHQMGITPGAANVGLNPIGPDTQVHQMGVTPGAESIIFSHPLSVSVTQLHQMGVALDQTTVMAAPAGSTHGPNLPLSNAVAEAGDVAWTNPQNLYTDNSQYMTASHSSSGDTDTHHFGGFGFAVSGSVVGIQASLEGFFSGLGSADIDLQLYWDGQARGNAKAVPAFIDSAVSIKTVGGAADTWGATPVAGNVNADDFGVTLRADVTLTAGSSVTTLLDYITITVHTDTDTQVFPLTATPPDNDITLDFLAGASEVFQPSVFIDQSIVLNHITAATTLYQMAVSPGAASIVLNHLGPTSTLFQISMTTGAVSIVLNHLGPTSTLYQMSASPGAATVVFDQFGPVATVHSMTIAREQFIVMSAPVVATELFEMFAGIRGAYWQLSGILSKDVRYGVADRTARYLALDRTPRYRVLELVSPTLARETLATDWLLVGTGTAGGTGEAWSNPENISVSDNNRALVSVTAGESQELRGTNPNPDLPANALPVGIGVRIEAVGDGDSISEVGLYSGGLLGTSKRPATPTTGTDALYDFGGADDDWGADLVLATVNGTGFGAYVKMSGIGFVGVDAMWIQVHYVIAYWRAGSIRNTTARYTIRRRR